MSIIRAFIVSILLISMLALTACVPKKSTANPDENKTATVQSRPMSEMTSPFLFLAAQNAMKDGNPVLAVELLEALVKKDPSAVTPRLQLIKLLLHGAKFDKAITHIDDLFKNKDLTSEQLEHLSLLKARTQVGKSNMDEALATLDLFLKKHPANIAARNLQVRVLSSQKRIDEALVAIYEAIHTKDTSEFRLLQAQLFINKGDTDGAKSSLQRMRELAPNDETPILMLSSIAINENKQELAEKVLRDFLDDHPDSLSVGNALGRFLTQQNRVAEAILVYRNMATQTGNDPSVLQTLGLLYLQYKEYKLAEDTFRKLFETRPNNNNRFYLAASLEAQKRDDEARQTYVLIKKDSPLFADAQIRLAGMDFHQNNIGAAEKRLRGILKKAPKHLDAHLMLSSVRINQEKFQLLLDESEIVLALKKVPEQLLLNRAVAFDHFKNYKQAEAMLKRILARNPKHAEALNFLGYTYAVQGIQLQQAEALIKRALVHKPDDGYYMDSLAWVYYKNGNYIEALRTQKKALGIITDDAVMFEHFGDILWGTGDKKAARNAWQKSIELESENPALLKQKISEGLKESK